MHSPTRTSAHRALSALLVPLLLMASAEVCSRDHRDWTPEWRGQGWNRPDPHRTHPRHTCLAKDTLAQRLDFASPLLARIILGLPDEFSRQLSDFDRGARLRTLSPVNARQFLQFTSSAAAQWTPAEIAEWTAQVERLSRATRGLNLKLPRIHFVKSTGAEEFDSAYTRGRAIVLPQRLGSLAAADQRRAFFLLAHELFHIISRVNPAHRETLYELLAFDRVAGFEYPQELEGTRLSNPDAFAYAHALQVQTAAGPANVLPVNQSTLPLAEAIQLPSIFAALDIVLLAVDDDTGDVLRDGNGALIAYNFGNSDWPPRMLRNSPFIIHPEEVLADNFATLMEERASGVLEPTNPEGFPINDPDLLRQIEETLTAGCVSRRK
jgi:hypothetical protein